MKIVVSEIIWPIGIDLIKQKNWTVVYDPDLWTDNEKLLFELEDADALIVRNQTKVDAKMMETAKQLKVIGRLGVGLDNIDLKAASERKVPVIFAKNANATSVSEYVISAMLSSNRSLNSASENVKNGKWNRRRYTGNEIYGKTLGLIGVGEIGHRVAKHAHMLGLNVLGYDPFITPYEFSVMESGIELVKLQDILIHSNFISLHVPLTDKTRNLIDADLMSKMKSTTWIINTSRGGIVNEKDLYKALQNKTISGAFLDVLEIEPPEKDHPLLGLDNCMITPHIAGLTEESQNRTSRLVANELIGELEGKVSLCRVK
ncbi:hydroxyacid dehydrogenase [Virgibacillus ndiopensis]|uniref:hydroxyacid dehydrogenase n=1 Tax=Virgibacillus ndiopensis TaxID=2004408 RepID=UPI000C08B11E|nr:hydroxyacid dehydrogenase [Virgibacillus ndiopensis]